MRCRAVARSGLGTGHRRLRFANLAIDPIDPLPPGLERDARMQARNLSQTDTHRDSLVLPNPPTQTRQVVEPGMLREHRPRAGRRRPDSFDEIAVGQLIEQIIVIVKQDVLSWTPSMRGL